MLFWVEVVGFPFAVEEEGYDEGGDHERGEGDADFGAGGESRAFFFYFFDLVDGVAEVF